MHSTSASLDMVSVATNQLTLIHAKLASIEVSVRDLDDSEESICALEEYRDQVIEDRGELSKLKMSLLNSKAAPVPLWKTREGCFRLPTRHQEVSTLNSSISSSCK